MNPNEINLQIASRRDFLSRAALATATTLGAAALARPTFAQTPAPKPAAAPKPDPKPAADAPEAAPTPPPIAPGDLDILNFALGLERLEAAFYAQILGAQQRRAYLSPRLAQVASEVGANEITHVTTLETAILTAGGTLPAAATYRFPANVFISPVAFSWFGYTLEEIGIGAYLGAVGAIQSVDLRKAAASIYGSEVRHAAILRSLGGFTFAPRFFENPLTVEQVSTLVAPYIS